MYDKLGNGTMGSALAAPLRRAAGAARLWPWYIQVGLIYAASRFVAFCIFLAVARQQGPSPWGDGQPEYLQFINIWDAEWYERIYSGGYPEQLPRSESGDVQPNAWAFYALFPYSVRAVSALTGLGWEAAAPIVATLAGLAALLVIYKLFLLIGSAAGNHPAGSHTAGSPGVGNRTRNRNRNRNRSAHENALWGVALVAAFPVSPILQVPYAESLHLLLLAASLYLLLRRDYLTAVPVVLLMCLARPAGVPFALLVTVHFLLRIINRHHDPFRFPEVLRAAALGLASAVGAVAWPLLAWWVTGELAAYTETETAWRVEDLVLFVPWLETGQRLFGETLGLVVPLLMVIAAVVYLDSAAVRRLGTDLRLWCAAYMVYLLAFLHPQTSTFRLLLPLFPLALAAVYLSTSRAYRLCVVVLFLLLQIVWVAWLWQWTQLPGGGDYPP